MIRRVFQVFSHGRVSLVHEQSSKFIIHLWRKSGPQTLAREFPSSRQNGCQRVKNRTFERSQHENAFPNQNFKFIFACFMRNLTGLAQLVLSLLVPFKGQDMSAKPRSVPLWTKRDRHYLICDIWLIMVWSAFGVALTLVSWLKLLCLRVFT